MEVENQTPAPAEGGETSEVDQLLADIAAGKETNAEPAAAPEAAPPAWKGDEWAFETGGKRIVPDSREKLLLWAGGGYNYAQRVGQLNKEHAERVAAAEARERQAQEIEAKYKRYAEIDEYAAKNSDWWTHVQESFQKRDIPQGLDPAIAQVLAPLQEKLGAMEGLLSTWQQQQQQAQLAAQTQQEDEALATEIESVRKSHPDIDLSARDESGETLENRVLQHCQANGLRSFRAGFRDLLFDQLAVQKQAAAKLQAVKGVQSQAKAGVLGVTPTPTKQLKPVDKSLPWSHPSLSAQAVLEEFRQTQGG